jgi:hypothetical protein
VLFQLLAGREQPMRFTGTAEADAVHAGGLLSIVASWSYSSVYLASFVRAVLTTCTDLHRIQVEKTARADRHFQSLRREETRCEYDEDIIDEGGTKPPDLRLQSKAGPQSEAYDNEAQQKIDRHWRGLSGQGPAGGIHRDAH